MVVRQQVTSKSVNIDWLKALTRTHGVTPLSTGTLASKLLQSAPDWRERDALVGERDTLSYGDLADRIRFYAAGAFERVFERGTASL